jgi:hypothetical protein
MKWQHVGRLNANDVDKDEAYKQFLRFEIQKAIDAMPKPKDGADGKDGASVSHEAVLRMIGSEVTKAVSEAPKPKDGRDGRDGESVRAEVVAAMVASEVAKAAASLPLPSDGKDGAPGRDALQIEVLDGIDEQRSYPRGTFATLRGGLVRSFRATDPLPHDGNLERSGWHVVTRGLDDISIGLDDDLRTVKIKMACTDGRLVEETFSVPAMVYRGVYERGSHQKGDAVTWGGSVWVARRDTSEPPKGPSDDWVLAVKRGKDAA